MTSRKISVNIASFDAENPTSGLDPALADGEIISARYGSRELKVSSFTSLLASCVEIAIAKNPAAVRRFLMRPDIDWLYSSSIRSQGDVFLARSRIGIAVVANALEALTKIYSVWYAAGLYCSDLRFECKVYEEDGGHRDSARVIPLAAGKEDPCIANKRLKPSGIKLDETQLAFVDSDADNIRLLAPAGSGKTTTLLFRCRALLQRNPKARILLLTFTRVAAEEIRVRMRGFSEFAGISDRVHVSTLNAYGYRIVRALYPKARLGEMSSSWKTFAIGNYARDIFHGSYAYGDMAVDEKWLRKYSRVFIEFFDTLKTLAIEHDRKWDRMTLDAVIHQLMAYGTGPEILFSSAVGVLREKRLLSSILETDQIEELARNVMPLYSETVEAMFAKGALTFEDQKYWALRALRVDDSVMEDGGYTHIMVDEFQDVNPIDVEMVKALREINNAGLTIVGDDDQTIFEWRGATPNYMLSPRNYFSTQRHPLPFVTYTLNVNYRSPRNIVDAATLLIRHNSKRVEKETVAKRLDRAEILRVSYGSYANTLHAILRDVDNQAYKSVAVITRKRSHLIPYQVLLSKIGRGYYAARDINVMLSSAFTDVIKVLETFDALKKRKWKFDEKAVLLILNSIRTFKLGRDRAEELLEKMREAKYGSVQDFANDLANGVYSDLFETRGSSYAARISGFIKSRNIECALRYMGENFNGLKKSFERSEDDVFFADPPFDELALFGKEYGNDYCRFCEDLKAAQQNLSKIESEIGSSAEVAVQKASAEKLHLMTGLRTKGKEYDVVYVLHCESDTWPNKMACTEGFEEGERRLFYVVMTRAKAKLCFVGSGSQTKYIAEAGLDSSFEKRVSVGKILAYANAESKFLKKSRIGHNDGVYRFVLSMKLKGLSAIKFDLRQVDRKWELVYQNCGHIESVTSLIEQVNYPLQCVGTKQEMSKILKKLESLMCNYEVVGYSVADDFKED